MTEGEPPKEPKRRIPYWGFGFRRERPKKLTGAEKGIARELAAFMSSESADLEARLADLKDAGIAEDRLPQIAAFAQEINRKKKK